MRVDNQDQYVHSFTFAKSLDVTGEPVSVAPYAVIDTLLPVALGS